MPHKWREFGRGLSASQKVWTFPFCWMSPLLEIWVPLSPDHRLHVAKKGISNSFQTHFIKNFISNTMMTYLKKLIETKSLNVKQCPSGLSPRIIPHYPRKHLWETLGMGKNPTQQPKIYSFPPPEKFPFINLLLSLSEMLFLSHQIVIFI